MHDKLYIDGKWVAPLKGGKADVINPATEEAIQQIATATEEDVDLAVKAARRAFDRDGWPKLSGAERAKYLRAIASGIRANQAGIARLEVLDNGKPFPEADWDIADAAGCFDFYAGLAEEFDTKSAETIVLSDSRFTARAVKEPMGVVGAIVPWNYPLLMASWKVAPALAAGCTVVLKPAELTSLTALELADIADKAGLPAGAIMQNGSMVGRPPEGAA